MRFGQASHVLAILKAGAVTAWPLKTDSCCVHVHPELLSSRALCRHCAVFCFWKITFLVDVSLAVLARAMLCPSNSPFSVIFPKLWPLFLWDAAARGRSRTLKAGGKPTF